MRESSAPHPPPFVEEASALDAAAPPPKWRQLTEAEARARRGFGLRGWLGAAVAMNLLLLVMLGFLLLRLWSEESSPAELAAETAPFWALRGYYTLCALCLLAFQLGAWAKWRHTPETAAVALGAIAALTLWLDFNWPPQGGSLSAILVSHATSWAVLGLIGYWLAEGRAPNLTFRRRVREDRDHAA